MSELADRAHKVIMMRHIIRIFTQGAQLETEPGEPEMGIRFPPCDRIPSATDFTNKAYVWLDMSAL